MAGFETIVRPIVFPNIRPAPTRSLPPADDPEQGKCTIGGGGGGVMAITLNTSVSGSLHNPKETERRVDEARVYQKQDDGTINRNNFIDIEVANKIKMESDIGAPKKRSDEEEGVGDTDAIEGGRSKAKQTETYLYSRIEEKDNIEIKRKNVIKKSTAQTGDSE